ncbi:hypothetical protein PYW07_009811 [Mythimna separata]|uniref:Uncharacterized protein n=1 Tax=Mythimna separata TaxID=271217 RepID=A0AAD7YCY9_MYTSE|nr:hypothetical protein PYW07_009811 [Mythimna separata]
MLQVLIISLVATSSAFTTHRYDAYDSFGNYRPNAPPLDNFPRNHNSNGHRPAQTYEYAGRYEGFVISDVYQRPSDGANRRVGMPYSYQNPYQWNRQVPWNRVVVTEPVKFFNRFEGSNEDREYLYNPDTKNGRPVVQQDKEQDPNPRKQANEINVTEGNLPQISTQSDDVNSTLVTTESQITWNQGVTEDNANITARSIHSDNNSNSLNVAEQNDGKINRSNDNRNSKANDSKVYSTKTTQDNEVTPSTQAPRTKPYEDDRWIWSNGEDQAVETTTLYDLDDRAAFSGNGCPDGKVKFGTVCVAAD